MPRSRPGVLLAIFVSVLLPAACAEPGDWGWRISPESINIQIGEDRPLQLLDDSAQELKGAVWSVDETGLGAIREEDGRVILHAIAAGKVTVSAALRTETRFREITILPDDQPIPPHTTSWEMRPIGREIRDLPAVPVVDGPHSFSLEQTQDLRTYLRAVSDDGIQLWAWMLPERATDVELVCGDWRGGAVVSVNGGDRHTLYSVGKDGRLRWRQDFPGVRIGFAITPEHLAYVLSQSPDGLDARFTCLDGETGEQRFQHLIPQSQDQLLGLQKNGQEYRCVPGHGALSTRVLVSRIFVDVDGFAYVAFTERERTLRTSKRTLGSVVRAADVHVVREDRIVLWQMRADGGVRSTVVEASKAEHLLSEPVAVAFPSGGIIPDGLGGVLLSVRRTRGLERQARDDAADEIIYRLDSDGTLVYRLPLPRSAGPLRDEMALGEDGLGFATRGGLLVAFNVREGREVWRWDSEKPGLSVVAALASGGCLVQTPAALVQVDGPETARVVYEGQAMIDWQGNLFGKHN